MSDESPVDPRHGASWRVVHRYALTLLAVVGWRVWLAIALMVGESVTDGLGVLLLLPLLALAGVDVGEGAVGRLSGTVSAALGVLGAHPGIATVLAVFVLVTAACALLQRWAALVTLGVAETFLLRLRQRLYQAIVRARWAELSRSRTSALHHALTTELERASGLTFDLLSLVRQLLVGAVYLLVAARLSPVITAVAMAAGGSLLLALRRRTRRATAAGERLSTASGDMFTASADHLAALKLTKSYGAEERSAELFSRMDANVGAANIASGRLFADLRALFQVGSVGVLSVVVFVALAVVRLPSAGVLLLLYLFARLVPRFSGVQDGWQDIVHTLPAWERVQALMERYESSPEARVLDAAPVEPRTAITLEGVSYAYDHDRGRTGVFDVTLEIPARRTTAIVGPSGAGKSTIADLVMGLLVPERGRVAVDGATLSPERVRAWRERVGYVAQDTLLFHDTIRANLAWASPDASEGEMREALRLAAADELVDRLPQGLDTVVGDRGTLLSGGERQRLALARALLRAPSLLILDEAANAVDAATESRMQRAIDALRSRVTVLVITHRLSTVRGADVIHVVTGGRLLESGSWDELIARRGHFAAMWRAQEGEGVAHAPHCAMPHPADYISG